MENRISLCRMFHSGALPCAPTGGKFIFRLPSSTGKGNESAMPSSRYPIGKTSLNTPAVGIGTGSFSGLYREVPEAEAIATIHTALDTGANLIDTAPWYGAFVAERY